MFKNKKILIIGGTGTIGNAIINKIISYNPQTIRILSRDEYKQFIMKQDMVDNKNIRFLIGDVRDKERLDKAMNDIEIVFNLAALKHVPACEYDPFEAVKTNVMGTQNVIEASVRNNVERVLYTSSDKAISPTNVMGATKLLAERLISSANFNQGATKTIFTAVRFGNVMGSRGSVIPLFIKQIMEQKRITVTDKKMSRFMMSISEAANLTLEAMRQAKGGEIFVLKMPIVNLGDLAEVLIEEVCKKNKILKDEVKIEQVGLRPGEKMYEELMTEEESETSYEFENMYSITSPMHERNYSKLYNDCKKAEVKSYSSEDCLPITKDKIREIILSEGLI